MASRRLDCPLLPGAEDRRSGQSQAPNSNQSQSNSSDDDSSSIEVIEVLETPRPLDNDAPLAKIVREATIFL